MNNKEKKVPKSFRLSQKSIDLLSKICEKENRNETNMIETLILEKAKDISI